jgi:hypothetical protein
LYPFSYNKQISSQNNIPAAGLSGGEFSEEEKRMGFNNRAAADFDSIGREDLTDEEFRMAAAGGGGAPPRSQSSGLRPGPFNRLNSLT